jgi:fructose-bisphosphate aldolase class 1
MPYSVRSISNRVWLERMLLKPNLVIAGKECPHQAGVQDVATATLRCLRRNVPAAVPGILFLSGGQEHRVATAHLNAINRLPGPKPWRISFSYGRALQDHALETWHGKDENLGGQPASLIPPGPVQQCGQSREILGRDGDDARRCRQSAAPP